MNQNKLIYLLILAAFSTSSSLAFNDANDWSGSFEGDIQFHKPYLFISLGQNCHQAQALRKKAHHLRDAAFPFDWLITSDLDGLIRCLDENFKNFFEESYFIRPYYTQLQNTRYNFIFSHDWPYNDASYDHGDRFKGQLEFIRNKFTKRITRFNNIRHFKGKVFFVRSFNLDPHHSGEPGWNSVNASSLYNALTRFFPELDFTLVVVSCTDKNIPEIDNIDGIKEYKFQDLVCAPNWECYQTMYMDLLAEFMPYI